MKLPPKPGWKLSLRAGFLSVFFCKGLQHVHRSGEALSAVGSGIHTSAREVPEVSLEAYLKESVVWLLCDSPASEVAHSFAAPCTSVLSQINICLPAADMSHTPELAKTGTAPLNSSAAVCRCNCTSQKPECFTPYWSPNGAETGGRNTIFITTSSTTFHFPVRPQLTEWLEIWRWPPQAHKSSHLHHTRKRPGQTPWLQRGIAPHPISTTDWKQLRSQIFALFSPSLAYISRHRVYLETRLKKKRDKNRRKEGCGWLCRL